MNIVPPLGAVDGTPYQDGNPVSGIEGSIVPAAFFNAVNSELAHLIAFSGQVPDGADLEQVRKAVEIIAGALADRDVTTVAANTALTAAQAGVVLVDATGGNVTITLPALAGAQGARFEFVRIDATANTVTIARFGADTIDGGGTQLQLAGFGRMRSLRAAGAAWRSVAELDRHGFAASRGGTAFSTPQNVWTTVLFDNVQSDPLSLYVPGTGIFTARATGVYSVAYGMFFGGGAHTQLGISILIDGSERVIGWYSENQPVSANNRLSAAHILRLTAGQTLRMQAFHNNGNVINTNGRETFFGARLWLPD